MTFLQLKSRLMNILMNALQVETDAQNTHMLLGGLLLCVQDAVTFEESELGATDHLSGTGVQHHEENILSSGKRTLRVWLGFSFEMHLVDFVLNYFNLFCILILFLISLCVFRQRARTVPLR